MSRHPKLKALNPDHQVIRDFAQELQEDRKTRRNLSVNKNNLAYRATQLGVDPEVVQYALKLQKMTPLARAWKMRARDLVEEALGLRDSELLALVPLVGDEDEEDSAEDAEEEPLPDAAAVA